MTIGCGTPCAIGCAGVDRPHQLALARVAPLEAARGAEQALEDLRVVAGVQDDEPHAAQHRLVHAVDDLVGDLVVRRVAPPGQHVGALEHLGGQAVLGLLERRRADGAEVGERGGEGAVDAVGVDRAHVVLRALVHVLVPDRQVHALRMSVTTAAVHENSVAPRPSPVTRVEVLAHAGAPRPARRVVRSSAGRLRVEAVAAQAAGEQPVEVRPHRPAPVAAAVELRAEQVGGRDADPGVGAEVRRARARPRPRRAPRPAGRGPAAGRGRGSCAARPAGRRRRSRGRKRSPSHSRSSSAAWIAGGGLAERPGVLADPLGDLGQRVRRPQPDRVEQRVLDQERRCAPSSA